MAAICRFCGQEFASGQAVKAHLKGCAAYRNRPKANPVPEGNPSGSILPLGTVSGGSGHHSGAGDAAGFDPVGQLEKQVAARRLRMTLREMDDAEADLDRTAEAKERERQRQAEKEAEGPRRAAQEREAERARAERARLAQERQDDARCRHRDRIQAIKQAVMREPVAKCFGLPDLSAQIFQAIERALSGLPVGELPDEELATVARAARDRIYRKAEGEMKAAAEAEREAQERDQHLAERKRRLIQRGIEFAKRELQAVEDIDGLDRYRINRQIEDELQDISGDESWDEIEDIIVELFEAEGLKFDDARDDE